MNYFVNSEPCDYELSDLSNYSMIYFFLFFFFFKFSETNSGHLSLSHCVILCGQRVHKICIGCLKIEVYKVHVDCKLHHPRCGSILRPTKQIREIWAYIRKTCQM